MRNTLARTALVVVIFGLFLSLQCQAQLPLLANGSLTGSSAGSFTDLSGLTNTLENGDSANILGGLGSGLAYAGGNTFLGLPDRGPNALEFNDAIDNTVTYIPRFHTISMKLAPHTGPGLPFTLTPVLQKTTLLYSATPLIYGTGDGLGVGSGAPVQNTAAQHYFSGRSDNFSPTPNNSGNPFYARLDSEGIRISNDGRSVYITDEYGPYMYQFNRATGQRSRAFKLPDHLFVANLSPIGNNEITGNTSGRVANKGMEGLALTPDGKTLVGIMQNALIQDAAEGGSAASLLRIVTVDIASGTTHEYAYLLTAGSGVSEIVALNNSEFLVDERDGHGRGDNGSAAKVKQIFKISLDGAVDISAMDGTEAATHAVSKTLFLDIVATLTGKPYNQDAHLIPAKLEGIALGPDVQTGSTTYHTLWVANDNDFLSEVSDGTETGMFANPNQFWVFGFTDADLLGSKYVPQTFRK